MKKLHLPILFLVLTLITGCREVVYPPMATPLPTAIIATPTSTPIPGSYIVGSAVITFAGTASIPLTKKLDNIGLGVLTAESEGLDRSKPVLELSLRGVQPEPCLARPCGELAGLVVRYSANLAHDDTLDWSPSGEAASQTKACGQGVNYHRRIAIGTANPLRVLVEWDATQVSVSTSVDKAVFSLLEGQKSAAGSLAFSRWIPGLPWPRKGGRSWLWQDFGAQKFGVTPQLESIGGVQGIPAKCP